MPRHKSNLTWQQRFWAKVKPVPTASECLEWAGAKDRDGYGAFNPADGSGRKVVRAHRYLYEQVLGPLDPSKVVMHSCDNRACVNLFHLALGSDAENLADRDAKRRQAFGERNGYAKLNEAAVREIRAANPHSERDVQPWADRFGVTRSAIYAVVHGRTWRHVA